MADEWCKLTADKFIARNFHRETLCTIARKIRLIDGCRETLEELWMRNIKVYIVSGSILIVIQKVMKDLFHFVDGVKANEFKFSSCGTLTDIIGTKYDFEGKACFIQEIAEKLKISSGDILFVGNSYNDKYAHISGANTLCINPKNTDPSDTVIWNNWISECSNLTQILPFVNNDTR